jgi:hypothetical protein
MKKNSTITFVLIEININIVSFSTNKKLQYLFLMKTMVENICSSEKKYYGVVINKSSEGKNIMGINDRKFRKGNQEWTIQIL